MAIQTYITKRKLRVHLGLLLAFMLWGMGIDAQKAPLSWYFGRNAALNFISGTPVSILNSNMNTPEGCATYSDNLGQVHFYTNGVLVWGDNHTVIANGTGLGGHPMSTQSAIVLPQPRNTDHVYIFTVDASAGPNGLSYTIVEMSGSPSIDPATKNISLLGNVTEKLTSTRHCNGRDFWVLAHEWQSDAFHAFLFNEFGVQAPVVSHAGAVHAGALGNCDGAMKVSPRGDKLALAITEAGVIEIFDFDNVTGDVKHYLTLNGYPDAYGVEFSPSGDRLFFSCATGQLYQVNLQDTILQNIINSVTLIHTSSSLLGSLQLAPDGKIYAARDISPYVGVITQPNAIGTGVNYFDNGAYLGGMRSEAGLPQYIPNAWKPSYYHVGRCLGDTVLFFVTDTVRLDSVRWDFGDPSSGPLNTSTEWCPEHYYESPGNYLMTLYYFHCDTVDSLTSVVEIFSEPKPYLGPDTFLCSNSPLALNPGTGFTTYLWHDGSTMSSMTANDTGLYWVEVTNICGVGRDSVYIRAIYQSPVLEVMNDTSICWGDSIWIEVDTSNLILSWWDGTDKPGRYISQQGNYFAVVRDTNGCMDNDQWILSHILPPNISLGPDTTICEGDMITLSPGQGFLGYLWNNGSTGDQNDVFIEGPVTVTVLNECGTDSDTMWVYLEDCTATLYVPNAFTPNGDGLNDIFRAEGLFIAEFSLQVFDRWGRLVYHGTDIHEGWDGTVRDMPAPPGAYTWRLYFKTEFGREGTHMGTVILHR